MKNWTRWDDFWYGISRWWDYTWMGRAYWYIRARIKMYHVLYCHDVEPGHYCDKPEKIKGALFQAVIDYVSKEGEDAFGRIVWDDNEYHIEVKRKLIEVLHWIHIERPEKQKEHDDLLHELYGGTVLDFTDETTKSGAKLLKMVHEEIPNRKEKTERLHSTEKYIDDTDQAMLHKVIDCRQYMWT